MLENNGKILIYTNIVRSLLVVLELYYRRRNRDFYTNIVALGKEMKTRRNYFIT